MLVESNTSKIAGRERCAHELFEQQVQQNPDGTAMLDEEHAITFEELNLKANLLAHHLRMLGVGPEVSVGLCLKSSNEAITALLGVLKAGGAFAVLDPGQTRDRFNCIMRNVKPALVLTTSTLERFVSEEAAAVLCLDRIPELQSAGRSENLSSGVTCENAACIVNTSGSRGRPKAIVMAHRGLMCSPVVASVGQEDNFSICESPGHQFWPELLLAALSRGVKFVISPMDTLKEVAPLISWLEASAVTNIALLPYTLLRLLDLREQTGSRLGQLRTIITIGAEVSADLINRCLRTIPHVKVVNAYGAGETGVVVKAEIPEPLMSRSAPIGTPSDTAPVYILDTRLQPLPKGVAGELCIAERGIARGYLNQPRLTSDRFIADPYGRPGSRMYRTGDLAKWQDDGRIEFVCRADRQLRDQGLDVDLREIETIIAMNDGIDAALITVNQIDGHLRLIANVVQKAGHEITASDLDDYLRKRLPYNMVPQVCHFLPFIPKTITGEVNFSEIPIFTPNQLIRASIPRSQLTPEQVVIIEMFESFLRRSVGLHDRFTDLGGDSLLATQVASRIRDRFNVEVSVESIFDLTVTELAAWVSMQESGTQTWATEASGLQ